MLDTNPTKSVTTPPPTAITKSYLQNLLLNKYSATSFAKCKFLAPSPTGNMNVIAYGNFSHIYYK